MFCPKCGAGNDGRDTKFCKACGLDLTPYLNPSDVPAQGTYQQDYQQSYQQPYQQPTQGQPYQQPTQGQPYRSGPYGAGNVPYIPSYLGWAIAVLICCFWPTGIAAVVFATQVNNKLMAGDIAGAKESSRKAKKWCWISFWIAIAYVIVIIIAYAAMWSSLTAASLCC